MTKIHRFKGTGRCEPTGIFAIMNLTGYGIARSFLLFYLTVYCIRTWMCQIVRNDRWCWLGGSSTSVLCAHHFGFVVSRERDGTSRCDKLRRVLLFWEEYFCRLEAIMLHIYVMDILDSLENEKKRAKYA